MGIVNVTPDSFSDGGARLDPDRAVADAMQMVADGVDLLDIGGESTRPGAPPVAADEEWRRIGPVLAGLRGCVSVPISVDTYKASVADRALDLGATIVNDISALTYDPDLAAVVARRGAAVVLMHNRGRSQSMYAQAHYGDVAAEVIGELQARGRAAGTAGILPARIIYDPGFGFAKTAGQSLELLAGLARLHALGGPLLAGPSRKSFLAARTAASAESPATAGSSPVPAVGPPGVERVWATAAAVTASILAGAHMIRVHDVREMVSVARAADAILAARPGGPWGPPLR